MKKSLLLFTCILIFNSTSNAQLGSNPETGSFRFGGAFASNDDAYGFAVFNEANFAIWNNLSAGPNIYFART
jgi:hypothetical protein